MTEEEWLRGGQLYDMLMSFPAAWDERKLWLFGCTCLRRHWHLLRDERTRRCVEEAERSVEGKATSDALDAAWQAFSAAALQGDLPDDPHFDSYEAIYNLIGFVDPVASLETADRVAQGVGGFTAELLDPARGEEWTRTYQEAERKERLEQTVLLREIFGNPFRQVAFDPAWQTETVVGIARGIYEDRAFERMPILADALQDAGCENADILTHCREPGIHVRGCWVVDLVLGKS